MRLGKVIGRVTLSKMIPAFAADGKGKMMAGGKVKSKGYAKGGAKMMKVKKTPLKASSAKTKKMTVAQLKKQAKMLQFGLPSMSV